MHVSTSLVYALSVVAVKVLITKELYFHLILLLAIIFVRLALVAVSPEEGCLRPVLIQVVTLALHVLHHWIFIATLWNN